MHNIAESTLRYYDEKEFFIRPLSILKRIIVIIQSHQFSLLDTIKFLRQLNIPLKEIKNILMKEIQHTHSIYWKNNKR